MPQPILSRFWLRLLLDFGSNLAENWVGPSNARTVNWQGTDCVPLAQVELQTVFDPFTGASCNAATRFESLLVSAAPGISARFWPKTELGPAMPDCQLARYWFRPISPCRAADCFRSVYCGFLQCRGPFWVAPGFGCSWDFGRFWLVNCVNWQ